MRRFHLLLGIHNHQPIGNFDQVFKKAHDCCYRPFLKLLREFPNLRISFHYSGPLLDWLEKNEPSFLDELKELIDRNQVELLTGGYYEPILSAIPERDGIGQINLLSGYLKKRLGTHSKGLWLSERVWDPSLPKLLQACGIIYTLVDDTHFQQVGLKPETLQGYYLTEREGRMVGIFPISKKLRYLVPFKKPEETIENLDRLANQGISGITYADDGEKFGLWPGTFEHVYSHGWLKRFFGLLEENRSWLTTITFSDYIAKTHPTGRIYLPNASYQEMMEWALPAEAFLERRSLLDRLETAGLKEEVQDFLSGGYWNHFMLKYPEINLLHKKMLYISEKLFLEDQLISSKSRRSRWDSQRIEEARRELFKGQGNDIYWHGLFGGYYLNYLRHEVYQHLIKSERLIDFKVPKDKVKVTEMDLDRDGLKELLAETDWMNVYLKPDDGATVMEIDYKPRATCLSHVPMRRLEAYHQQTRKDAPPPVQAAGSIPSIHDLVLQKEPGLDRKLIYDRYLRSSFRDHLIRSDITIENFGNGQFVDLGGFSNQPYETSSSRSRKKDWTGTFYRRGMVNDILLQVKKTYKLSGLHAAMTVEYEFEFLNNSTGALDHFSKKANSQKEDLLWGVELNLTLLAGSDPKRYYFFPGKSVADLQLSSTGIVEEVAEVSLIDEWQEIEIQLCFKPSVQFWRFPVETVSQSEEGLEATYQGSCLVALWPLSLPFSRFQERQLTLSIVEINSTKPKNKNIG